MLRNNKIAIFDRRRHEIIDLSHELAVRLIETDDSVRNDLIKFSSQFGDGGRLILICQDYVGWLLNETVKLDG